MDTGQRQCPHNIITQADRWTSLSKLEALFYSACSYTLIWMLGWRRALSVQIYGMGIFAARHLTEEHPAFSFQVEGGRAASVAEDSRGSEDCKQDTGAADNYEHRAHSPSHQAPGHLLDREAVRGEEQRDAGRWQLQRSCRSYKTILIKSLSISIDIFILGLVIISLFILGICAIIWLDKGALTPKSFTNIELLFQNLPFFKKNSCPKAYRCKWEFYLDSVSVSKRSPSPNSELKSKELRQDPDIQRFNTQLFIQK